MYRAAICDDDAKVRLFLRRAVEQAEIDCEIDEFPDGHKLLMEYKGYDLLFLYIDMPGADGIQTAERIRRTDRRVKIIYVTGYQDYMERSFAVHPFAFLVKPVRADAVIRQIREALLYEKASKRDSVIRLQTAEGIEEFLVSDIYYLEYQNRKIRLVARDRVHMLRGKISVLSEKLTPYGFASPHKSFSVNLFHVKAIRGYDIHMANGDTVPLSQKRSSMFRGLLGKYQGDII